MVICDYCKAVLKTKEELHNHHLKAHTITIQQRSADETKDRRKSFRNKKKSLNKIESDESEAAFAKYQFDFEHGDIPVCSNDKKDGNQLVEESDQGDDDEFFDANEGSLEPNEKPQNEADIEEDTIWKEEFVCAAHRPATKDVVFAKMTDNTHSVCKEGGELLVNIKINTYAIDKLSKVKFKLNNMNGKAITEEKACHRQHSIQLNSVTYQLLVENFVGFGDRLGIKPKRHDVDNKGENVQDQYNVSLNNSIPVSVTYYHTTNKILIQLKAEKELKGAKKASRTNQRIIQLRNFVKNNLSNLIKDIENDRRYEALKLQMESMLNDLMENLKEGGNCQTQDRFLGLPQISEVNTPKKASSHAGFQRSPQGASSRSSEPKRNSSLLEFGQVAEPLESRQSPLKENEALSTPRSGEPSPSTSPRKRRGKTCNDDCEKIRTSLNLRVSTLEKEKLTLQQKYDTVEKHQEALRCTISSNEGLISTQTQLVADHVKTINSQKKLISDMEIKSATHSELASSFLDVLVSEGSDGDDMLADVNESNILQQMHEKIKDLQTQVSANIARILEVEKERDTCQITVTDLKQKLGTKTRDFSGLKTQLSKIEESMISKEKELKDMQSKLADSNETNESLRIDNAKLGSLLTDAEKKIEELSESCEQSESADNTKILLQQVAGQLKDKDMEIKELKEAVDFSEASVKEAKLNWKQETSAGKRLQGLLNEEKKLRVEMEDECSSLQAQLAEEKAKLERYKSLSKISSNKDTAGEGDDEDKAKSSHLHTKKDSEVPIVLEKHVEEGNTSKDFEHVPCIFELREDGACQRKDKCKFDHKVASEARNDPNTVNRILTETCARIGKCAFEMTQKGSCPGESICKVSHNRPDSVSVKQGHGRRLCFRELMTKGSCPWGNAKCRFSHKITDEERNDNNFVASQRQEKDEKASKCLNEFRGKGCCNRKDQCPFSHKISDVDRNNEELKKSMREKTEIIKKKKDKSAVGDNESSINNSEEKIFKDMLNLKKELLDLMAKMKASSSP